MSMYELLYRRRFHSYVDFAFRESYPDDCFFDNWHIELMADLMQFMTEHEGEDGIRKVIFNLPPGHFKTHLCSVFFPTWLLGRDPRLSVLIIAEHPGLAYELQERCVELMSKSRFRALFPRAKIKSSGKTVEFNYGGGIHHTGTHCRGVRQKSDLIIIDNPQSLQSVNRLDPQTLVELPRLLKDPKRGLIVMNTRRLGENDMTHHLLQNPGWTNFSFPVVSPDRQTLVFPPYFEYTHEKGEPLQPEISGWSQIESSLHELGWKHFLYQQMQGCYELNTHDRTYTEKIEKDGMTWITIGEVSEDQIARRDFKKLRENYSAKPI